jgi:thiamine biosynthesis lipoprotein
VSDSFFYRRAQPWLGTIVEISILLDNTNKYNAAAACHYAFLVCRRIHNAMSPQIPSSDIARFNNTHVNHHLTVDAWTIKILQEAQHLHKISHGLFDIAQGSSRSPFKIHSNVCLEKIDETAKIDLGGIAKGFAVDCMVASLRAHGIQNACVNAGGDLRVIGKNTWPIHVRGAANRHLASLQIQHGSIASSAYLQGKNLYHHDALFDPQTGTNSTSTLAISVAAPRCVHADALTKVIALSGNIHHPALAHYHAVAWHHQ